jgi:1,4-alpha-glucan branching enzyme
MLTAISVEEEAGTPTNGASRTGGEAKSMTTKKGVMIEQPPCRRVNFRLEAPADSDVCLAGTFNNWDPSMHRLSRQNGNGAYAAAFLLPVGRHEYKFVVNGEWQCDPACPDWVPNEHGTMNSVIEVS